ILRNRRDANLTTEIYRRCSVLQNEKTRDGNPWSVDFKYIFRSANDRDIIRTRAHLKEEGWPLKGNAFVRSHKRMLPLYEAKMVDFFNHRAADVVKSETAVNRQNQPRYLSVKELQDPTRQALPLNWIQDTGTISAERNGREVEVPGV